MKGHCGSNMIIAQKLHSITLDFDTVTDDDNLLTRLNYNPRKKYIYKI